MQLLFKYRFSKKTEDNNITHVVEEYNYISTLNLI